MGHQMSASEHYKHGLVLKRVQMFYPAIEDFRKAALDPQYAGKAWVQIALCLRSLGRHEEAVMAFRKALATRIFSWEEERYILYHIGQTLETLGRYAESLEIYNWIRNEDPDFSDVAQRIAYLTSGGYGLSARSKGLWHASMEELWSRGRQLKPQMASFLAQTGRWLNRHAEHLTTQRLFERGSAGTHNGSDQRATQSLTSKQHGRPVSRDRAIENRRHTRVPVRMRSHFSSNGRMVAGEGELRDLSPWGCRIKSVVTVPVGESLECCIFPQDTDNPFIIDGASVRWISPQEFGLAFTKIRPGVQRQIAQLCRTRTMSRNM
ncbi:PilZ domain-containing protein [Petrachloros mirabilis]